MSRIRVTEAEFENSISAFLDKALQEPIFITKEGKDYLVLLSFEEFTRLKHREQK